MKRILILTLSFILSAVCLRAQQTIYVIDNVTVDHFDGSQLKGKSIKDYQITTTGKGSKAITVHSITTSPGIIYSATMTLPRDSVSSGGRFVIRNPQQPFYTIINGKKTDDPSVLQKLSPAKIKRISVLKDSLSRAKYASPYPVIEVETKELETDLKDILDSEMGQLLMQKLQTLSDIKVEEDGSIVIDGKTVNRVTITGTTYKMKE